MVIKKGDHVAVTYEGRFEDGAIFDSSTHGDHSHPLEFDVGEGQVVPGFEDAVIGMNKGDTKEFTLTPEEAYGEHDETLTQTIPRSALPPEQEPQAGMMLLMATPEGHQIPVQITSVDTDTVTLDLNHPLAGKTLIFSIEIVGINETMPEHAHMHEHTHDHNHSEGGK